MCELSTKSGKPCKTPSKFYVHIKLILPVTEHDTPGSTGRSQTVCAKHLAACVLDLTEKYRAYSGSNAPVVRIHKPL